MTARLLVGDVFDRMGELADGSIDLVLTSPPFLALRSYLPPDHPDKHKEIGSEPTPAAFIDTLLRLTAEWRRLLAPHGSIAVELGDTYSGSGGAGGDYNALGMRAEQPLFRQSRNGRSDGAWPLEKSLCLIPELYRTALVYGLNPLTGQPSPAGRWRVRNVVRWCRPNPPVGALGDKFRPATTDMVIACTARDRYFDLDAVRTPHKTDPTAYSGNGYTKGSPAGVPGNELMPGNPAGAPPLDWWDIPTQPYKGKSTTTRREPCGPHDGGQRTTSPDCPVHADLPGQLPKALRDAHAGTEASRTRHNGGYPSQEQLDGFAPTGPHTEPETGETNSDLQDPSCAPAASPHSSGDRRTGLAPTTSPVDTPSVQMSDRTARMSTSPELSDPDPDMSLSNSDEACPPSGELETLSRTADTSDPSAACTCSFTRLITESTSHYATWPPALCDRPIQAMCPRQVCTTCGQPSRRITETVNALGKAAGRRSWRENGTDGIGGGHSGDITESVSRTPTADVRTLGWSDCGHNTWRTGIVLDPFAGSGTTLAIATGHGRDAIGIDLDPRNVDLARERCGMFLTIDQPPEEVTAP